MMEGLEDRRLLAVNAFGPSGGNDDTGYRLTTLARNIGTVTAFQLNESEPNNSFGSAQLINLGTGPGQARTIDVSGSLRFANPITRTQADIDYFAVDLQAGDILDIATIGSVGAVDVFYAPNRPWFGAELDASFTGTSYPYDSPLQTLGDITAAQTVPVSGRYYIQLTVGPTEGLYTMGLRVYRPVMEQAPVGQKQILFLDFDGASYARSEFDPLDTGVARLRPLSEFLFEMGLRPQDENALIDRIVNVVKDKFADVGLRGLNGDYALDGIPGNFGIEVLNSRDHADEYGINPYVSRVIIGGSVAESGVDTIGLASSIDVGNFDTSESSFVLLDQIDDLILPIPFIQPFSILDTISTFIGNVAVHEAGHFFGAWHQDNANALVSVMDQGGDILGFTETGPDGIYGTVDDNVVRFTDDFFSPAEGIYFGREDTLNAMAHNLSTGLVGGTLTGTVFADGNRNGVKNAGEAGLAQITVFADLDGDGVLDGNEPSAVTNASGQYTITVPPGVVSAAIVLPAGFEATTPTTRSVTVPLRGTATADFGIKQVNSGITGVKWNDINGNGQLDAGEPGLAGVFIYLDLDGDNRLDLGEPRTTTGADGTYILPFPGAGTYTIREVRQPGFRQTFPGVALDNEHIVVYNGITPITDRNFGNQSVQDFGDAPAPFPTTGPNAAVHGILDGLRLGALIDAEPAGQPTVGADGDNNNGQDDEDGVTLRSALSPGANGLINVAVVNTTGGPAYLSAWIDLNGDGDWADAGEKFASDILVSASGDVPLNFTLPSTARIGDTYARFRLSQSPGVGFGGFTDAGEVEDYLVNIAESPELANNDTFDVPRGSTSFPLNILANDFDPAFDPLTITSVDTTGTLGQVVVRADGRSVFYTPKTGVLGPDSFTYTVTNASGTQTDTARVDLNVVFQSAVPIAVDDSFYIPQGSGNQPLNVLGNDIPSIAGGLRVIATSAGTAGGTIVITSGGQSIRYTPAAGFAGTEQFNYTVSDSNGATSTATATVHLQPGAQTDDVASFIVETFAIDGVTPINTIPAGRQFKVRVSVDDLRNLTAIQGAGLSAAYLDLLYTDGLVSTIASSVGGTGFPFQVDFGPLFSVVRTGDALTPGLINEIGATQSGLGTSFSDPVELFTITMLAVNPGVAEFTADPADAAVSDVVLLNDTARELTPPEIRFGRRQLTIVPSNSNFTFAVDDSYPDQIDSAGNPIVAGTNARLNVLANDNRGPSGVVEIVSVGAAASGTVTVNNNNTAATSDDYLNYRPNAGFVGVDQFTYTIVSGDGIQSTAKVTVTVGNAAADDLVDFQFNVTDMDGNPVTASNPLTVGEQFKVQILVDDLRAPMFGEPRGVFAAYMDLLYNFQLAEPAPAAPNNEVGQRLGFQVEFGNKFDPNPAVGDDFVPGLINEFGTFQTTAQGSGDPLQADPVLLATITMVAKAPGNLRITADPADVSPFQDTLLFQPPDVVPIGRIRYDVADVPIVSGSGGGEGESNWQNRNNRMDVNNDSSVSPIDALLVLNRLNRTGEGEPDGSGDAPSIFWDVNGDRRISPIDALQVINFLNRGGNNGSGEGEGSSGPLDSSSGTAAGFASAADVFFGEIGDGEGEGYVSGGSQGGGGEGSQSSGSDSGSSVGDDSDDDDDDDLQLLGDQ
jgi:hypothetical protein